MTKADVLLQGLNKLGTEPSVPLAYATGSETRHPTIRMMRVHGGHLEIYRERDPERDNIKKIRLG